MMNFVKVFFNNMDKLLHIFLKICLNCAIEMKIKIMWIVMVIEMKIMFGWNKNSLEIENTN